MRAEVVITADDGAGADPAPLAAAAPPGAWVLVAPPTVAATRAVLAALAARDDPVAVAGWADLTAPNLVDLLVDLAAGPGGGHLRALAVRWPVEGGAWLDDVAVRRGLACLAGRGLALRLLGRGPGDLPAALARAEPDLEVVADTG